MVHQNYATSPEYLAYVRIADGTPSSDLQEALSFHQNNRGDLSLLLQMMGLRKEPKKPLHIQAFEDVLRRRASSESH